MKLRASSTRVEANIEGICIVCSSVYFPLQLVKVPTFHFIVGQGFKISVKFVGE